MTTPDESGQPRPELEAPAHLPLPPRRPRTEGSASSSAPAGHGARFAAACVDLALWFLPPFGVGILAGAGALRGVEILTLVGWGYLIVFLAQATLLTMRSQSVGKMLLGLRIVRSDDESKPGFVRLVFVRMVVTGVLCAISNALTADYPFFPFLWVDSLFIFRSDRRCLHDLMAETKVIAGKPGQIDVHAFD